MVRLYVPGTYAWSAESAGAYAERGVAAALTRGGTITIPRRPLPSWSAETGLHLGRFPDARASLRFAGDRLFARAGVAQYVAGLRLDEARYGEAPPPVLLSLPYAEAGLGLGAFALAPGARTRPYAVLSAFGRFFWGASPGGLDPSASMGLSLALGAEWPMAPRLAGFVELGAALYPWSDPAAMLDFAEDRGAGTWSLSGERWFFEYPLIRFGARFLP
jgi:hypothetical protein